MLPLWIRVDLGAMAMKRYSTFPKTPVLLEHHYQIVECHILKTLWVRGYYSFTEVQSTYPTALVDKAITKSINPKENVIVQLGFELLTMSQSSTLATTLWKLPSHLVLASIVCLCTVYLKVQGSINYEGFKRGKKFVPYLLYYPRNIPYNHRFRGYLGP